MPVVLFGRDYWQGLLDWLEGTVVASGKIGALDPKLLTLTDDVDEAVQIVMSQIPRAR